MKTIMFIFFMDFLLRQNGAGTQLPSIRFAAARRDLSQHFFMCRFYNKKPAGGDRRAHFCSVWGTDVTSWLIL